MFPRHQLHHHGEGRHKQHAGPGQQQSSLGSVAEDAPAPMTELPAVVLQRLSKVSDGGDTSDVFSMSALVDEEESCRVVIERDEQLGRIREYTDFHDQEARIRKAEMGEVRSCDRDTAPPTRLFDMVPRGMTPTPPEAVYLTAHAPSTPSQQEQRVTRGSHPPSNSFDRTLIDFNSAVSGGEGCPRTRCMSVGRDAPQPLGAGDCGACVVLSPVSPEASQMGHLQFENTRMAMELQENRRVVQQLHESLLEAREALSRRVHIEDDRDCAASKEASCRQQGLLSSALRDAPAQPPLVSSKALFSSSSSTLSVAADSTAMFTKQDRLPPCASSRPSDACAGGGFLYSNWNLFDVAEFFWALQVAPPPSTLHDECPYRDHCHASTASLRSLPEGIDESAFLSGAYGATDRAVERLPLSPSVEQSAQPQGSRYHLGHTHQPQHAAVTEEEAALACESAWVNSNYYCYNIMSEMSSLRVVHSLDEVGTGGGTTSPTMNEEEMTRKLLDHTPTTASPLSGSFRGYDAFRSGRPLYNISAAVTPRPVFEGALASVRLQSSPESAAVWVGGLCSPAARRYVLPYLQRLWVTSVLRHLLLFLLVTLTCILVFIPGIVLCTVNVFEATNDEDFYALRNRFGRSAMLVAARLDACTVVCFAFFGVVCLMGGRWQRGPSAHTKAQEKDTERAAEVEVPPVALAAAFAAMTRRRPRDILGEMSAGTLVHLMLCTGTGLMFLGAILFREGCRNVILALAVLGEACYGAGEALLLGGLSTVVSAEVGLAAGVNVSAQILLLAWLAVNAFGFFVLPKLNYYVYITRVIVDALVYVTGFIGAFVFGVVMLCPPDLIGRAVRANSKDITPRKLWSAARHDVSSRFFLRTLTVGLLTAAVMLLMCCGFAAFIPTQAVTAAVSESRKSREFMGTHTGHDATGATESLIGDQDSWTAQQRNAPVLLFTYALVTMPLCFIPRLASLINQCCPVSLLTTFLCAMWMVSTGASWVPVLGLDALATSSTSKKGGETDIVVPAVLSWCRGLWVWLARHHFLNPSMGLCGFATGAIYTIVVSSLLRSMANGGVRLPVMHPSRWRMTVSERDHTAATAAAGFTSEATPLLGSAECRGGHQKAKAAKAVEFHGMATGLDAPIAATATLAQEKSNARPDEMQRCVQMQLRGGPTVMTALACILTVVVLLVCVAVMTTTSVLLTDRDESPVYGNRLLPGVTLDEHLVVKSILTCVLAAAMIVQWVEVCHGFGCRCV
ncbi:hypothetical protein JKF63_06890 [Porcisia hertigi]|uniref:Transmembrane protein n=1 Tax=Porcisia hertigi TaxID=2761500 RepID=A0A836LJB6_9TRYP|nr:hypothetical protein JKF63_06890 [Porcisia hertigi]